MKILFICLWLSGGGSFYSGFTLENIPLESFNSAPFIQEIKIYKTEKELLKSGRSPDYIYKYNIKTQELVEYERITAEWKLREKQ